MAQAAGKDCSPYECLEEVRSGGVPLHLAVEKLGQVAFGLCNDVSAASELYQSAKRTQDHFFDYSEDNMLDREKKKQQGDFMSRQEMNYAKKVTKKISDRATKFGQSEEDKNIFEDEIDELQKLAADNMALAELAAKRAADARRKTMQQKEVVGELNRNTMSDVAERQQQSESPESSRDPSLADPDTPGRTAQVTKNLQEVANYDDHNYGFKYDSSDSEENELEFKDGSPAAARKPAAIAKKPPEVPNVNDDEESSANDSEALAKKPPAVPKKKPAAIAKKPPAVKNVVDDEGSSANDDQPLVQFASRKGSVQEQGEGAKTSKSSRKRKQPGQQMTKTVAKKPAPQKTARADRARSAYKATVAKSTTSPVTRSDTSNKRQKGNSS
jgi:hypothetical protein